MSDKETIKELENQISRYSKILETANKNNSSLLIERDMYKFDNDKFKIKIETLYKSVEYWRTAHDAIKTHADLLINEKNKFIDISDKYFALFQEVEILRSFKKQVESTDDLKYITIIEEQARQLSKLIEENRKLKLSSGKTSTDNSIESENIYFKISNDKFSIHNLPMNIRYVNIINELLSQISETK